MEDKKVKKDKKDNKDKEIVNLKCRGLAFRTILQKRLNRREMLEKTAIVGAASLLSGCAPSSELAETESPGSVPIPSTSPSSLSFTELPHGIDENFSVSPGYQHQVLIRWGDPIFADAPDFDPLQQTKESQLGQFGFNNDFVGFVPLPLGSNNSDNGLLVVNHEFSDTRMMFPGSPRSDSLNLEQTDVDIAAHGLSVIEIRKVGENWGLVRDSSYNRRISPNTPMKMTGPAAGNGRLKTILSEDGVQTFGTYYNCAGGVTPWGTILTAEENIQGFFTGDYRESAEVENYDRFRMRTGRTSWGKHYQRWDLSVNPREPLHMGWIVEIDPYDPEFVPCKRTALGRCKHEGCNVFINSDNRVVAYTGDDEAFEYIYKFISSNTYQVDNRAANMRLLEEGTLFVARFNDDGSLNWLPLIFDQGPLTVENGFNSQGDVLLDTRKAADLMGATPMDRPEDVEVNPQTGKVYVTLTNNRGRSREQIDNANPRAVNTNGQILEFWPADGDHKADVFNWEMFILAGNPEIETQTSYHPDITNNGWLSCPDNLSFDSLGNIWIGSDGAEAAADIADGIWAAEVEGPNRALSKRFIRVPTGAEFTGPFFTPDDQNLFCAVQHPAEGSSFDDPDHRWPDFDDNLPPRPSVVVVTKTGGGRVGS